MELNMSNTVQLITIVGFASLVVKLLIISPLQTAITALNDAVKELKTMLSTLDKEQKESGTRLTRVEESVKSAHKRLDGLEGVR